MFSNNQSCLGFTLLCYHNITHFIRDDCSSNTKLREYQHILGTELERIQTEKISIFSNNVMKLYDIVS